MPRWPSSLRSRLTLWYTVFLGLPLIVFAVAGYLVFSRTLQHRTDRFIGDELTAFSRELIAERRAASSVVEAMRSTVDEVRFRDLHIAILDTTGRVVAMASLPDKDAGGTRPPPVDIGNRSIAAVRGRDLTKAVTATVPSDQGAYRVISRPLTVGGRQFSLTGSYSLSDSEEILRRIRGMFLVAIPLLVLSAAAGGYSLAKRSLAPVASMAAQAAEISASNLDERLPVGGGDELVGLARVVNDLLDRLERSFAQQRSFVTDASHELRTPAAILRTEADITLSRAHRAEDEYRASVTVMQDAARRLTRIVDDLFLLARADSGDLVAHREALYLEDLVDGAARAMRSVADGRAVHLELRQLVEAPVQGDADLLGRLLLNLLDNAIRYSPEGGTVEVGMTRRNDHCEVMVVDQGPVIPPEARERVFERFFRVDAARSRSDHTTAGGATGGAGLGLAIARRIAELHAGRLELTESRPGRTQFRLTLPVEAPAAGEAGAL
jgi:two-component system OmpR family sensor kinase